MVEIGVKLVAFQPRIVIDQRPVTAQLGHEHLVAQTLRGAQIIRVLYPSDAEALGIGRHCKVSLFIWPAVLRRTVVDGNAGIGGMTDNLGLC